MSDNGNSLKAISDATRCMLCDGKFGSDDVRRDIRLGFRIIGTIHEDCYLSIKEAGAAYDTARVPDVSQDREA